MARYPTEHAGHVYDSYRLCIFRSEGAQSVVEHHAPDQWRRLYGSALLDTARLSTYLNGVIDREEVGDGSPDL
jgi:hypothetical protein